MLATGMAGRSRFGADGIGQVLSQTGYGGSGDLGGGAPVAALGGGFKRMAGLGALGYLAYRALQERRQNAEAQGVSGASHSGGGILGDLFGQLGIDEGRPGETTERDTAQGSLGDRLSRVLRGPPQAEALPEVAMEDQEALLLIRAMIAAANADGSISAEERNRILSVSQEAGIDEQDRRVLENELANPRSIDQLLPEVQGDPEKAEQVFLASRAAVDRDSETGRAYLAYLAARLGIPADRVQAIQAA
jgi:uncharacterized membrane protein YebE (DUF533 family)